RAAAVRIYKRGKIRIDGSSRETGARIGGRHHRIVLADGDATSQGEIVETVRQGRRREAVDDAAPRKRCRAVRDTSTAANDRFRIESIRDSEPRTNRKRIVLSELAVARRFVNVSSAT